MSIEVLNTKSTHIIIPIKRNISIQTLNIILYHGFSSITSVHTHSIDFLGVKILLLNKSKEVDPAPNSKCLMI